jgi:serine/threonine protein kinase
LIKSKLEHEIEKLINLRHPCVAGPIGFVLPIESGSRRKLKIVRLYLEGCSLSDVLSVNPAWFTSTVKAKAVAGIVLGLRFAHSLGLVHGHLTMNNLLFDSDHCIQIVDFNPLHLEIDEGESKSTSEEGTQLDGFSGERLAPDNAILFELMFGCPPQGDSSIPMGIPNFVSRMIKSDLSPISGRSSSFITILEKSEAEPLPDRRWC